MTPTKKIFLAAAFVAAGYGVAYFLGAPKLPTLRLPAPLADSTPVQQAEGVPLPSATLFDNAGARLVPDAQPVFTTAADSAITAAESPPEKTAQTAFEMELASVSAPPLAKSEAPMPANKSGLGPRAKLRNEVPRALAIEPRAPVAVKDVQQAAAIGLRPVHDRERLSATTNYASNDVVPAQFSDERSAFGETPTTYAIEGQIASQEAMLTPRPFPRDVDVDQPRAHIIVDGDSLAKLAGRYLDDPQRANEIYELNRHLLSDPDLLPIGAELAIPTRSATLHSSGDPPQSLLPRATAIHAASRGGLVPVRPIPTAAAVMPRAQLARPLPAE